MTSQDKTSRPASNAARTQYEHRTNRHRLIKEGMLASVAELIEGAPFFGGHIERDVQAWCDGWMLLNVNPVSKRTDPHRRAKAAVRVLRDSCTLEAVKLVETALAAMGEEDGGERMQIYRACLGDRDAAVALAARIVEDGGYMSGFSGVWQDATARGLLRGDRRSMDNYCVWGVAATKSDHALLDDYDRAGRQIDAEAVANSDNQKDELLAHVRGVDPTDADFLRAVLEDRAEFWQPHVTEIVVVPAFPEGNTGHKRDIQKSWKGMDGQPLPVQQRGDVAAHSRSLNARWPHAAGLIDTVLTDLAVRDEVRFRPTLFVGAPGSGKTSLARAIFDQVGLMSEVFSMAGIADSGLAGTSAHWSTAREAVPLQLIKRAKSASVGMIWDEVEKASESRHNGSAFDALLPLLEIDQARRFRDLALECECDLSFVSNFATANSIDGIPAPLRDRMRILVMPDPEWQHVGVLSQQIIERLARERGVDPRWYEPLAGDELELVHDAWPGGSIRKLTRIVTALIDGRQSIMGRA